MKRINHVAVWVAGIVQFMLGAGWYTALGRPGWQASERTKSSSRPKSVTRRCPTSLRSSRRSWSRTRSRGSCPGSASASAAGARRPVPHSALALIGTTLAQNYGFEARPLSLWLINAGYMVVGMAIMGAIVGHWRKAA